MGKAVPKAIKSKAKILLKEFPSELGSDYEKNKKFIDSLQLPLSKVIRNKVAGFSVRTSKKASEQ